jgi:hypothetical protein
MDLENGRSTPFWTSCERQRYGDFIAGTVVIQCALTNRCSHVAITHLNVGNFSANNEQALLYPYFPRTKSGPNLLASDPKPEQEPPAHVNLGRQRLAKENWSKPLSSSLLSGC